MSIHSDNSGVHYFNGNPSRPQLRKPVKPNAPKGHEAFLKALESSGCRVEFEKVSSGERLVGKIKASDKYTVSVICEDSEGGRITRVLFKHDISEFSPLYADGGEVAPGQLALVGEAA